MSSQGVYDDIAENIAIVKDNIASSAIKSGRNPEDITLMAVTKTVDSDRINFALQSGISLIGENKVQEILKKSPELSITKQQIHMIGHLQRNKVNQVVPHVAMIQSVDSVRLAKEIAKKALALGENMPVLVQVNIGREENKSGFLAETLEEALFEMAEIEGIKIEGLMTIPPFVEKPEMARPYFSKMKALQVDIMAKKIDNISMNTLSMGMSMDYQQAILEGATLVRVGSSIFGKRN